MGQKSVRLFIALELPATVQETLYSPLKTIREQLPPRVVRWTPPPNIHLTLKFLGDVPLNQVEAVQNALKNAVEIYPPLDLVIQNVGCFPNAKRPYIVWVGLQDITGHLGDLQKSVEEQVAPLGYPRDDRPFKPHLTIGRVKRYVQGQALNNIGHAVQQLKIGKISDWQSSAVSLMESNLLPDGAQYTCRYTTPFKINSPTE